MNNRNEAIFPIITFDPDKNIWKCLGTGFFINLVGAFVTAKHLFFKDGKQTEQTLYGVQNIENKEYHLRPVTQLVPNKSADVMIGTLGKRRLQDKTDVGANTSVYFALDFEKLDNGEKIFTFAYPNSEKTNLETGETEFLFKGINSLGTIVDFCENGSYKVKNRCYQTNMDIQGGASGGPVFKNGYVIGINSSSFDLTEGEEPISYITPIDFITELNVKENGKLISVKELIEKEYIKVK
ncbi:hypothetical protein GCM10022393_05310 [Aquimarina addita]|uniref:Serine protease n=1 Tax=Aquimarina addita TaxID=870485 RepID=A0ABP7XA24_9FLAO